MNNRIKELGKELKLTQSEFAEKIRAKRSAIASSGLSEENNN